MKQTWTRLAMFLDNKCDWRFREARFIHLFLKHHQHADELIYAKSGEPLAALYFTPDGKNREETKRIFKYIQERILYRNEFGEDNDPHSP